MYLILNRKIILLVVLFITLGFISIRQIGRQTDFFDQVYFWIKDPLNPAHINSSVIQIGPYDKLTIGPSLLKEIKETQTLASTKEKNPRVIIMVTSGRLGDTTAAYRMQETMEKKGWKSAIIEHRPGHLLKRTHIPIVQNLHPDFTISLDYKIIAPPAQPNYLIVHMGQKVLLENPKNFNKNLKEYFLSYDGFLLVGNHYEEFLNQINKTKEIPYIFTYFTCPETRLVPLTYTRLFYCGSNWDTARNSKKYQSLYGKLDKAGYLDVYGPEITWKGFPSYRGFIPNQGDSLHKAIQNSGVALVLHGENHLTDSVPSARIFEAVAAGTVVICDQLPFAKSNFGDTLLYVDQNQSAEEMFKTIDGHMNWIRNNPDKARELTQRAHEIFLKKFTLEAQLQAILEFHKKVSG